MGELIDISQEILVAGEKSDQEKVTKGAELISRQSRNARDLGTWFNSLKLDPGQHSIKDGDHHPCLSAKEIVAAANRHRDEGTDPLNYATAREYGFIVEAFPKVSDQLGMAFTACRRLLPVLALKGRDEFNQWHYNVSIGICPETDPDPDYNYTDTKPKPLVGRDLKRQIDIATGKKLDAKSDKVEEATSATVAIENLVPVFDELHISKPKQRKVTTAVTREVKRIEKEVRGHFVDEVNAVALKIAEQRTVELREAAEIQRKASKEARLKYERDSKVTEAMRDRLPMFMTKAEYKFLLNVLHPDRAPADRKEKFQKAFNLMQRLEQGCDWEGR